ncbi:LemA family protein [PVC group bacterium]|nr:LemA family protein [PVC group bacterium]
MNRVSETIKRLFPREFEEIVPVKQRWWQKMDFSAVKSKKMLLWVVGLLVVSHAILGAYYYNNFVTMETQVRTDFAQIEAHMQRRKDLIINLTKTVVDYAEHERMMFKYMADQRNVKSQESEAILNVIKESGLSNLKKSNTGDLEGAISRIMALAEAYPVLKLSDNFQRLMEALINIEDRIVERRMAYNTSCNLYGTYLRKFPQNIFTYVFRFKQYPFIEVDKDAKLFNRVEY